MNYFKVTEVIPVTDTQSLLKNTTIWIWVLCYFFKWQDFTWDVFLFKSLDVHSGIEKIFALSSLQNYKQFLYLLNNTKKIWIKILCEFSELSYWEKLQVLAGTKKIKGLAATWLEQLQGKILMDETILSQEEYNLYRKYLSTVTSDIKKIDLFLSMTWVELKWLTNTQVLNRYLQFNG